jgi:uncharacterized protein with PIN domain
MLKAPIKPRTSVQKNCEICNDLFWAERHVLKMGRGRFCSRKCRSVGIFTPEVRKKMSDHSARKGKIPYNFKHENAGYNAIHAWIRKHYGRAFKCFKCKTQLAKKYEWANVSGKYLRDINDYLQLCSSCHAIFDGRMEKAWITRKSN